MPILLKNILKEAETRPSVKYQLYCDMDGVLVDLDAGFKKIADGMTPKEYTEKNGKNSFWRIVSNHPDFWINLPPMPDAKILWNFISENFKDPLPIILSAGLGSDIKSQKTKWIQKYIDPSIEVKVAPAGYLKSQFATKIEGVTNILLDDTGPGDVPPIEEKDDNITAWKKVQGNIGIHHTDAASSIQKLTDIISV